MLLGPFIPIRYIFFLALGIILGHEFKLGFTTGIWISGVALLLLGGIHYRGKRIRNLSFEIISAICLLGIGTSAIALDLEPKPIDHYSRFARKHPVLKVELREELRSSAYNNRFIAEIIAVDSMITRGKILLYTPDSLSYLPDTQLLVPKSWQAIRPPLNPGQFDFRLYMAEQGIYDEVRIGSDDHLNLGIASPSFFGQLRTLRKNIAQDMLEAGLSTATVATTEALLLGERQNLDTDLYNAYKDAGAVHILAVSGLHIGILVLLLKFFTQPLRRIRHGDIVQISVVVVILWSYALFIGMSPSVVRAVTLFSFISYAWMIKRPSNMYNTLALSFFFILLAIRPTYLFQVGFQMSYAAVLGILWIYPKCIKVWRPKSPILKKIWQLIAVSLAAQLGVIPISLYYFHQFPGLFFVSNLLLLPFLGMIVGLGLLVLVLVQLGWQIDYLNMAYDTLIQTMNNTVTWIGGQEHFVIREVVFDRPQLLFLYGLIITLILFLENRKFKMMIAMTGMILLFQIWTFYRNQTFEKIESLYILHTFKQSILLEHIGNTINVYSNASKPATARLLSDYQLAAGKGRVGHKDLQNSYRWGDLSILVIDGSGILEGGKDVSHILLTQSPPIHLERLLRQYPDATIIADGSNYPSYVQRWQESCNSLKRSFHYTGKDGAYQFTAR